MTGTAPAISLATLASYARDRLGAATRISPERLLVRQYRLPRLDLEASFASPQLADLCERRLVMRRPGEPGGPAASLRLLDPSLAGWEAPAVWDTETGFSSRDFERTLAAEGLRGYYHHDGPSWQFYDGAARAGVHVLPDPTGIPPWEAGSPLRLFLHWAWAGPTRRLTHAATLGLAGSGALIVGPSGSGKSGTTLAGFLNGLTSAGDDYVLVEQGDEVTAHAVFRVFKQDPQGLRRAGLDATRIEAGALNWHGKHEFDAMTLRPASFARQLSVRAVYLPEIARAARTRIEPVPAQAAALALAPSAVLQLPGDAGEGFRFFSQLTRRLPAYRVLLSENPVEIADALGAHLAREAIHAG